MKKVVSFICFVVALAVADDTIDLSSAPLSHEVQNVKSSSTGELGIGYVRANFEASQAINGAEFINHATTGSGNGVDFFTRYNYCFTERFGINLGTGLEFIKVKWGEPLLDYTEMQSGNYLYWKTEEVPSDNVLSWYFNIGLFVDVWKTNSMVIRLFGNAGYGAHWFLDGTYYKDRLENTYAYDSYDNSSYNSDFFDAAQGTAFFELGMRYIFAKRHGLDLVYKFNSGEMFKSQSEKLAIKTSIKRTNNFVLRYVYEFKD